MPIAILLAGAGPPLRASLSAHPRQRVNRYLLHSNAVQGIGLRSFGLPFACDPAPWYARLCARPLSEPSRAHRPTAPTVG
jgi:hypothetical protein